MKSILVILPNLPNTWTRAYSSTVGDKLPTNSLSGFPEPDEADGPGAVEAGILDGPACADIVGEWDRRNSTDAVWWTECGR